MTTKLTKTQYKVLSSVGKSLNGMRQIGGDKAAPYLSAARALKRRGLLNEWKSSEFAITPQGKEVLAAMQAATAAEGTTER